MPDTICATMNGLPCPRSGVQAIVYSEIRCAALWFAKTSRTGDTFLVFDERFVDDHLGGDVRQFTSLPCLHLLSHGLKIPLHPVHAYRNAVDERDRLRVLGEHRGERSRNNAENSELP